MVAILHTEVQVAARFAEVEAEAASRVDGVSVQQRQVAIAIIDVAAEVLHIGS